MSRDKNKKLMILIALVSVVSVTIGFATYATTLIVKSGLSVNPILETFSVVFSSSETDVVTNKINPTVTPTTLEADSATISNEGTYPTISDLNVVFTEPGEKATYTFYAINKGKYDAYLTSIVLENIKGTSSFKKCVALEGATQASADSACDSINVNVKVGDIEVNSTVLGIKNHKLLQEASEVVTITIEYKQGGTQADGPVEVYFGNLFLTYSSGHVEGNPEIVGGCKLTNDIASNGIADIGDEVTCGTESFYVIPTDSIHHPSEDYNTVSLLGKYNINIGEYLVPNATVGIQGPMSRGRYADGEIAYSGTWLTKNYWYDNTVSTALNPKYEVDQSNPQGYPGFPFVYDSSSSLYQYLSSYETYLKEQGVNTAKVTMPSVQQLLNLGCELSVDFATEEIIGTCTTAAYSWVYYTTYWTGTAYNGSHLYVVSALTGGGFGRNRYTASTGPGVGIRPVVIVNQYDIGQA